MSAVALCPTCRQPIAIHRNGTFESHARAVPVGRDPDPSNSTQLCGGSGRALEIPAGQGLDESTASRRARRPVAGPVASVARGHVTPACPNCAQARGLISPMKGPMPAPHGESIGFFFVCERCNHTMKDRRRKPRSTLG